MIRFFAKLARKTASFFEQWAEGGLGKVWATTKERLRPTLPRNLSEWLANAAPSAAQLEQFRNNQDIAFTIIVPVYETPPDWLTECLNSVREQTNYPWQCIVVDDASTSQATRDVLKLFNDPCFVHLRNDVNQGVAASCNTALDYATGDFVLVLDHDDALMPHALHRFAQCILEHEPDVIYADEAITGPDLNDVLAIRVRPAFSPVYYWQHPYFVHPVAIRTSLLRVINGWDAILPACHDVELMDRILALKPKVAHLPEVLYRWRTHDGSLGHAKQQLVIDTMVKVVSKQTNAKVEPHPTQFNVLKLTPPVPAKAKVAIIIPFKNRVDLLRKCVRNLERTVPAELVQIVLVDHESTEPETLALLEELKLRHRVVSATGPFNFSKLNNDAVKAIAADVTHLLFLNNDVFALTHGWLESMLGWSTHAGIVGAMLAYPDGTIQHAGIGLGLLGGADNAYRGLPVWKNLTERSVGENCELICVREVSAVSAACMLIRRTLFDDLGGFDETYVVGFNDVDLCLRARAKGEAILLNANAVLVHEESQSRGKEDRHPKDTERFLKQYADVLAAGDPYLSPLRDPSPRCDTLIPTYRCPDELTARVVG